MERKNIEEIVFKSLIELNESLDHPVEVSLEARLFGGDSVLDSVDLVNLIVIIEDNLEKEFNRSFTLADEKAMSRRTSPFSSVKYLIDYILEKNEYPHYRNQ